MNDGPRMMLSLAAAAVAIGALLGVVALVIWYVLGRVVHVG